MKICIKCNQEFPAIIILNGKRRNLQSRRYCLKCSPFGMHNTTDLTKKIEKYQQTQCRRCNRIYIYDRKKGHQPTLCNSCVVNLRRYKLKQRAVEYKGGKCIKCGYSKCISVLGFHHRDPKQKSFQISGNHCYSWKRIKKELDKCDLLCANCHGELRQKADGF